MNSIKQLSTLVCLFSCCLLLVQCNKKVNTRAVSKSELEKIRIKKDAPIPDAIGLNGEPLFAPIDSTGKTKPQQENLAIAKTNFEEDPSLENTIWYGRRNAYLWRYKEAIDIYTKGILKYPNSPELYRHRGHRFLTIRKLDEAILDFQQAAKLAEGRGIQVEKDGIPNDKNIPLSNLQFNIYYHWALAHYLKGEFETALNLYQKCMDYSINSDLLVATADWMYMTYRRLGTDEKTAQWEALRFINENMTIIENDSYYQRCLVYKRKQSPESLLDIENLNASNQLDLVTLGYGLGNWYFYNGDEERADQIFNKVKETGYWSAFGYLAAEADLARFK